MLFRSIITVIVDCLNGVQVNGLPGQNRKRSFIVASIFQLKATEKRYTQLMLHTGELVMDMGTVLDGRRAVKEKLIDELGGLSDALAWLYKEIERG